MSADLVAIVVCALVTAALAGSGPALIRRLPEPVLESDATDKVPYAELGARPGLAVKLAIAGALVGAIVGWQLSGQAIIVAWIYLGAAGVVLAYVDSQTRLLPTRLIAPSYLILIVLSVGAWLVDANTDDLVRAGLAREVVRFLQESRKQQGFDVSDRIEVRWRSQDGGVADAIEEHAATIADEVLAVVFEQGDGDGSPVESADLRLRAVLRRV